MIDFLFNCRDLLVALAIVAFAVLLAVLVTAAVVRRIRGLTLSVRSPFSLLICAVFLIAVVDCGADKVPLRLTSWLASALTCNGLGEASQDDDASDILPPQSNVASDCFVSAFHATTNALVVKVVRVADGELPYEPLDVLFTYSLATNWTLLSGSYGFAAGATNAVIMIGAADMPGMPTNMPTAAFVQFGRRIDSDADGLYDARESRLYGTAPDKWDTDGDGLGDGVEIAGGLDPLALDSDDDGYDDDEECIGGGDPLVFNSGAQSSARYYYDEDDRLLAVYLDHHAVKTEYSHGENIVRCEER